MAHGNLRLDSMVVARFYSLVNILPTGQCATIVESGYASFCYILETG